MKLERRNLKFLPSILALSQEECDNCFVVFRLQHCSSRNEDLSPGLCSNQYLNILHMKRIVYFHFLRLTAGVVNLLVNLDKGLKIYLTSRIQALQHPKITYASLI